MKKCKSCQSEIDAKATKCPHCQTDQRSWFRRHPILTGIFGLFLLFTIIGVVGSGSSSTETSSDSKTESQGEVAGEQQTKEAEAVKVDTLLFVGEFDKNQLAAEEKYENKWIEASGYIGNISEDITGTPFIILQPTSEEYYYGTSIQCFFENKSDLTSIENGQKITILGKVDTQVMNVLVKECQILVE